MFALINLLFAIPSTLAVIALGVIVFFWKRGVKRRRALHIQMDGATQSEKAAKTAEISTSPAECSSSDLNETILENAETSSNDSPAITLKSTVLSNYASCIVEQELKLFMEEIATRVKDEEPNLNADTPFTFVEELVDRIDDLRTIVENQNSQNSDVVTFRNILLETLADCGAELIHADQWEPSLQRAIAKEPRVGIETPAILRYGTSGFRRNGQLVRKQEVVLAIPPA